MIPQFLQALSLPELKAEKGTLLLKEGNLCQNIYIIRSGIARLYFTYRRKELTTQFFFAGNAATSVHSFLNDCFSTSSIDVIEDCELLVLSKEIYEKLMAENRSFREWFYHATVQIEFTHSYHLQDVMQRRAQDRYGKWRQSSRTGLNALNPGTWLLIWASQELLFNRQKNTMQSR